MVVSYGQLGSAVVSKIASGGKMWDNKCLSNNEWSDVYIIQMKIKFLQWSVVVLIYIIDYIQ